MKSAIIWAIVAAATSAILLAIFSDPVGAIYQLHEARCPVIAAILGSGLFGGYLGFTI